MGRVRNALKVAGADTVAEVELKAALADPEALVAFAPELDLPEDERSPEQVQAAIGERFGRPGRGRARRADRAASDCWTRW